jgi:hypothetical protein
MIPIKLIKDKIRNVQIHATVEFPEIHTPIAAAYINFNKFENGHGYYFKFDMT